MVPWNAIEELNIVMRGSKFEKIEVLLMWHCFLAKYPQSLPKIVLLVWEFDVKLKRQVHEGVL